ncbi:MAG: hypothetical protein COB53_05385 [Elusimicrobia bacterium]|nr:MAG: hypothetical protein COB53_05385 [Elusimicrobiota bacterium]
MAGLDIAAGTDYLYGLGNLTKALAAIKKFEDTNWKAMLAYSLASRLRQEGKLRNSEKAYFYAMALGGKTDFPGIPRGRARSALYLSIRYNDLAEIQAKLGANNAAGRNFEHAQVLIDETKTRPSEKGIGNLDGMILTEQQRVNAGLAAKS